MSIMGRFLGASGGTEKRTLQSSSFVPPPAVGVIDDFIGVHRAMAHMTVFACVRLLADTIASLPWKAYRRDKNGIPRAVSPQPAILNQPYPGFDLFQWKWMAVASMALRGNSYHFVTSRDKQNVPTALLPLHPDIVFLERRPDILEWFNPIYRIMGEAVPAQDMIHMRRFTMPGEPWGVSPIRQASAAIGMGLAAEEYGHRFYKESATPSGILTTDQPMDEGALQRAQQNWIQSHGGRRLPAILSNGFKFEAISIRPDEAQFLECVVPGTLVTMADGTRQPVEELRVGDRVMSWNGSKLEPSRVKAIGTPPLKPIVKITTARGRELVCTDDHPVLGLKRLRTPGGRPAPTDGEWIKAGDLQPGQYVRVALGNLNEETPFSSPIAYFLGAMVGDGYIRSGCCAWASGDEGVTSRMATAVESLGGELRYKDRCDYNILTRGVGRSGSIIRGLLNESGLIGTHSHDKFVPDIITAGGPAAWRGFLSAYFDADGSIRPFGGKQAPAAYWSSTSRELLDGCQHLLALLGINSAVYPMGKPGMKMMPTGTQSYVRQAWGLYVMGVSELTKLAGALDLAHSEKKNRLANFLNTEIQTRYRPANFQYDSVKEVSYIDHGQTIGVEIEGTHTFVTSGIITHNTRQFQRSEICLLFGVPPILIGDTKETTAWGTGVEQITLGAVTYTFRPWTSCIESVMSNCLPRGQFVRFDYSALLRGDFDGHLTALKNGIQGTIFTANEARAEFEMDPVEGGDQLIVPPGYLTLPTVAAAQPAAAGDSPSPTPGKLPTPPIGGGENTPSAAAKGNGSGARANDPFVSYEQELRRVANGTGNVSESIGSEEG